MSKTLTVTLQESIYNEITRFAKENGISKSGAISVLCTQQITAVKAMKDITSITEMIKAQKDITPEEP